MQNLQFCKWHIRTTQNFIRKLADETIHDTWGKADLKNQ